MDLSSGACSAFKFTITFLKNRFVYTPPPSHPYTESNIFVQGSRLDAVDTFIYFGSDDSFDFEIHQRIKKANKAFGKLCK